MHQIGHVLRVDGDPDTVEVGFTVCLERVKLLEDVRRDPVMLGALLQSLLVFVFDGRVWGNHKPLEPPTEADFEVIDWLCSCCRRS